MSLTLFQTLHEKEFILFVIKLWMHEFHDSVLHKPVLF